MFDFCTAGGCQWHLMRTLFVSQQLDCNGTGGTGPEELDQWNQTSETGPVEVDQHNRTS